MRSRSTLAKAYPALALRILVLSTLSLLSPVSRAATLAIVPSAASVQVGNSFSVDLVISGLVDFAAPSLGSYDIEFAYDDSLVAFDSVTFGGAGPDQLDLLNLGSITVLDASTSGTVFLGQVSLDDTDTLNNLQLGSFTLARLYFLGSTVGSASLSIANSLLADALGDELFLDETPAQSSIQVVPAVPVPAAVWLFASSVGLLPLFRRSSFGQPNSG